MPTVKCKRQKNFTEREIEVLLAEVESRRSILCRGPNMGISLKRKRAEWHRVCVAVNAVGTAVRTAAEVKKKWFDLKVRVKKLMSAHKESVTAGWCAGAPQLSPLDERLACIMEGISTNAMVPPLAEYTAVKPELEDQKMGLPGLEEVLKRSEETPEGGQEVGAAEVEVDASALGPCCMSGEACGHTSGHALPGHSLTDPSLTDSALQTQKDLIRSIDNMTSELKHIGTVLHEICSTLKMLVKT